MGGRISAAQQAGARLKSLGERVILSLDNYEVYRLMDAWLRQVFLPSLPDNVRAVFRWPATRIPARTGHSGARLFV
jgi:hypothetical protein